MINMKIKVENNLDEIVKELERLGYKEDNISSRNPRFVYTGESGHYFKNISDIPLISGSLTTLAELKDMQND